MTFAICPRCGHIKSVKKGVFSRHSLPGYSVKDLEIMMEYPPPDCPGSGQPAKYHYPLKYILDNGLMKIVSERMNSSNKLTKEIKSV